jgi:hypothetical protein
MIMKNYALILVLLFSVSAFAHAQENPVPESVQKAFDAKFSSAKKVEWEEDDDAWEAEFKMKGKEVSAQFNTDGDWLETETEIKPKNLPAAVTAAINSLFPGSEIEEAERVETPDLAEAYEVELENGKKEVEALFLPDGTLLAQEVEEEGEEKEDEEGKKGEEDEKGRK